MYVYIYICLWRTGEIMGPRTRLIRDEFQVENRAWCGKHFVFLFKIKIFLSQIVEIQKWLQLTTKGSPCIRRAQIN